MYNWKVVLIVGQYVLRTKSLCNHYWNRNTENPVFIRAFHVVMNIFFEEYVMFQKSGRWLVRALPAGDGHHLTSPQNAAVSALLREAGGTVCQVESGRSACCHRESRYTGSQGTCLPPCPVCTRRYEITTLFEIITLCEIILCLRYCDLCLCDTVPLFHILTWSCVLLHTSCCLLPGRTKETRPKSRDKRPASSGNAVKFNDQYLEEIEPDEFSIVRTTPLPSSVPSA